MGRFVIDKSCCLKLGFRVKDCMPDCVDGLDLDDVRVGKSKHFLHSSLPVLGIELLEVVGSGSQLGTVDIRLAGSVGTADRLRLRRPHELALGFDPVVVVEG